MAKLAICSIDLDAAGAVPDWIMLLPYGQRFSGRDGRGPYTLRDQAHAQQVITATRTYQAGADLPIDYDHQLVHAVKNGQPAIAGGWIKDLEARPDGLYGRVEWTAKAAQHLAAREYRYISPMFTHDKASGEVLRVVGAGLVNMPNLEIPAIASQNQQEELPMDLVKILAALLGLGADTTQDQLVAHCQKLQASMATAGQALGISSTDPASLASAARAALDKMATALGQQPGATVEQLVTAAQSLATSAKTPDPAKFVPIEQLTTANQQLKQLQDQAVAAEVDAAIKAGKVAPALKDWALGYASQDLQAFKTYVAGTPAILPPGNQVPPGQPGDKAAALSAEQLAICSQLGITEEAFLKSMDKETA